MHVLKHPTSQNLNEEYNISPALMRPQHKQL